jgi:hypothetical protein
MDGNAIENCNETDSICVASWPHEQKYYLAAEAKAADGKQAIRPCCKRLVTFFLFRSATGAFMRASFFAGHMVVTALLRDSGFALSFVGFRLMLRWGASSSGRLVLAHAVLLKVLEYT